jgi:predicted MFS family arabinose efflux permease
MTRRERRILFVALVCQAVGVGVTVGSFTLFVEPLEQAFEAPRAQVSFGNSLLVVALALAGTSVGSFLDRGYARRVMFLGGILMGGALVLAASATHLWMLALAALLAGIAIPTLGPLAGMSLVSRAIAKADRGRAMGIVSMGTPLGSGLFAAIVGWAISQWGWRGAYGLLAVLTLAIVLPLVGLLIPSRLESTDAEGRAEPALELGEIARMPAFWLTAIVFALVMGFSTGWASQLAPFLTRAGLGEAEVAGLIALQFWMGIPGSLLFGALADRVGLHALFLLAILFQAVAFACYASGVSIVGLAVLAVGFGFSIGGMIPLFSLILGRQVGADALGRAMGLSNLLLLPSTVGSITFASLVYDRSGAYTTALIVFSIGSLVAAVCLLVLARVEQPVGAG